LHSKDNPMKGSLQRLSEFLFVLIGFRQLNEK